jgi:hypothetical protein
MLLAYLAAFFIRYFFAIADWISGEISAGESVGQTNALARRRQAKAW